MADKSYFSLQPSESCVVAAASRILAAFIRTQQLNDQNENRMVARAVELAVKLAAGTEAAVVSDDELEDGEGPQAGGAFKLQAPQVFPAPKK